MKVSTVNLVEYVNDSVLSVRSFSDDPDGNKDAETDFRLMAKENGAIDEDMDSLLEDGYYEQNQYQLFLTHSS